MVVIEQGLESRKLNLGRNAWLIAYDIGDPRRLARVHRLVRSRAIPLQYSVFIAWLKERDVLQLADSIGKIIDPGQDDVRLYHLPARLELHVLGRQWMPDGVVLYQEGCTMDFAAGDMEKVVE